MLASTKICCKPSRGPNTSNYSTTVPVCCIRKSLGTFRKANRSTNSRYLRQLLLVISALQEFNHQLKRPHFQCLSSEKSSFSLHEISLTDLIVLFLTSRINSFQNSSGPLNVGLTQTACVLEISLSILINETLRIAAGHRPTLRIHVA